MRRTPMVTNVVMAGVVLGAGFLPTLARPSLAWGTRPPKPVISSFSAVAVNPGIEDLAVSPLTLYSSGGPIHLQATVSGGSVCDFRSNRGLPNLPTGTTCGSTVSTQLPANVGKKPVTYRFRLRAIGSGSARAAPIVVIVGTTPNPNPPVPIVPGGHWYLKAPAPICSVLSPFPPPVWEQIAFNADGTFTEMAASSGFPPFSGTYTLNGSSVALSVFVTLHLGYDIYSLSWDSSTVTYNGTENLFNCGWILSQTSP